MPEFIAYVDRQKKGQFVIAKDGEGYYKAVIREVRKVKDNSRYCCYGIKGQIQDPPDGKNADSDWIFFWRGMYDELQVGDWVRFKVSKSEVKHFPDIGYARNLYPAELVKV